MSQIQVIAIRLRALRDIEGLTIEEAAVKTNVSVEEYASYESGAVDIPVSFLYEAAKHFKVELVEILEGEGPKLKVYQYVKDGHGADVERSQQYKYKHLAYNFVNKKAEPFLVTVDACDKEIHTNTHPGQEFDYCLEGRIKLLINNTEIILEKGDSIYYDSSYPHGMKALDGQNARFLAIIF